MTRNGYNQCICCVPVKGYFNDQALEAYELLVADSKGFDFSEGESTYDFTRCVRPDGSAYGTGGKCRQGTESGPAPEPVKKAKDVIQEGIKGSSPSRLKQMAKESGSNSVRGDLTVTPEGKYILKGKKVTLNEAIMYLGKLNKAEEKQTAPEKPKRQLATKEQAQAAWKAAADNFKKAEAAYKAAVKAGGRNPDAETQKKIRQLGAAADKAENLNMKAMDAFDRASKRNARSKMSPSQRREERKWDQFKKEHG